MSIFSKKPEQEKQSKTKSKMGNPNWTKGVSGNPNGRPKIGNSLAEKYRDAWSEAIDPDKPDYTKGDAIIDAVMKKALKGDLAAIQYLEARGFGKLLDRVQLEKPRKELDLSKLTDNELEAYERILDKLTGDISAEDKN